MTQSQYPTIILHAKGLASVIRRHPWIFSGAIAKMDSCEDGDIVNILDKSGMFLGVGYYQDATIAIRLLSRERIIIDRDFWTNKIADAYSLRNSLGLPNAKTDAYRLIHGEGDHLPGLVIDIYNTCAVIQCHAIGIHRHLPHITTAIKHVLGNKITTIYNKSSQTLPREYASLHKDGYLLGSDQRAIFKENEIRFEVDIVNSQKTGFFLDQRENRALLSQYSLNKKILNLFAYTGGFSLYGLCAGAEHVTSIDISAPAIQQLTQNLSLNSIESSRHQALKEDVLSYLQKIPRNEYDIIIVDPPAFAKSHQKKHNAVQAYKRLNAVAINKVKNGGLIFTFSCSQVIDPTLFYNTIIAASLESSRNVRVIHILSQSNDHPVNAFHPEGKYLKGLVLFVN